MTTFTRTRLCIASLLVFSIAPLVRAETPQVPSAVAPFVSAIDSQDPSAHLTYASILFYKGLGLLQSGKSEEGQAVFHTIEGELLLALKLSEPNRDAPDVKLVRSQSAFLLGEVTLNVFKDNAKAKQFYEQALREYPEHDGATRALARLLFAGTQPAQRSPK